MGGRGSGDEKYPCGGKPIRKALKRNSTGQNGREGKSEKHLRADRKVIGTKSYGLTG